VPNIQTLKDQKLQKHYDDAFAMHSSDGWKDLMEDAQGAADAAANVRNVTAEQSVDFRRGQLHVLDWLLKRKEFYEQAYDMLLQEQMMSEEQPE